MWIELAAAGFMVGSYIYHRLTAEEPKPGRTEIQFPITEEGEPVAKIFGRCRVRRPVVAWIGEVSTEAGSIGNGSPNSPAVYRASVLFSLGAGFSGGTHGIHGGWAGDRELSWLPPLASINNYGAFGFVGGDFEILLGGSSQHIVDSGGSAVTATGTRMLLEGLDPDGIPGYRNRLSIFLYGGGGGGWYFGDHSSFPSYHFDASSYGTGQPGPIALYATIGDDANPVSVIYAVLTDVLDMLGLPASIIDVSSFAGAAHTMMTETHGYSRCWDSRASAAEIINDVLRQIDGMVYEDQRTGKICLKLVRNDYNPATLPVVNRSNCRRVTGFAMNSRVNVVNKVRVVFEDREKDYDDNSAVAQNMSNAVGQDGQVVEEVVEYRGCKKVSLAQRLAERELGIRSRPMVKCSVEVSRSFIRTNIGDVLKLVWNAPDINAVFRVVGIDRGAPGDETIRLDLILDVNYVWRNQTPIPPATGGLDVPPVALGS